MNRYRSAYTDGESLIVLECKYLAEGAYIQPFFAGFLRVFVSILNALECRRGAFAQAAVAVITAVLGLHEYGIAQILHAVSDFALDAHIRNFSVVIIVHARTVAVHRITIAVCHFNRYECDKIDLVL